MSNSACNSTRSMPYRLPNTPSFRSLLDHRRYRCRRSPGRENAPGVRKEVRSSDAVLGEVRLAGLDLMLPVLLIGAGVVAVGRAVGARKSQQVSMCHRVAGARIDILVEAVGHHRVAEEWVPRGEAALGGVVVADAQVVEPGGVIEGIALETERGRITGDVPVLAPR